MSFLNQKNKNIQNIENIAYFYWAWNCL